MSKQVQISRREALGITAGMTLGAGGISLWDHEFSVAAEEEGHLGGQNSESMGRTGLLWDARYLQPTQRKGHPESPERLKAIEAQLISSGLKDELVSLSPTVSPVDFIGLVHSEEHIQRVGRRADKDAVARLAVSGALTGVEAVCTGKVKNAFCALRPPGHHAANNGEFGFCFYNNIAVAARYAQKKFGLKKILTIDWDYHHGDGTEWAFYEDPTVLCFSTHALKTFPGSGFAERVGAGKGKGYNINVPLPKGATDEMMVRAFEEKLIPAADSFKPDMVLVSAGFDSRKDDLLGNFEVTDDGFSKLTHMVKGIAEKHAKSRLVSMLEGGYNIKGLALAVESHLRALREKG